MLGDRLKELRIKKGATQDDLAALLNIKRQTYSAYERNVSLPDIPSVLKLAEFFGVSVGYIIGDKTKAAHDEQPLSADNKTIMEICSALPEEEVKKVLEYVELLKLKQNS